METDRGLFDLQSFGHIRCLMEFVDEHQNTQFQNIHGLGQTSLYVKDQL
ncbi:hypothetical protein ACFQY3_22405 [Paenibacillus farraposensis]